MSETKHVIFKVKRQAGPKEAARWEEFSLKWRPSMNVIICLRDIAENPVTRDGKKTTPISYDSNCLEEICGSCAMLIKDRKSTRLNSSHITISYAVFCLKKKKT